MSNEEAPEGRRQLPLTGVALERAISEELKWLGFRYGAPIYRAVPRFTFDDLTQALFNREKVELSFWAKLAEEEIRVHVTRIQTYDMVHNEDLVGNLFPRPMFHFGDRDIWVLDGLLLVPNPCEPGTEMIATAAAYGSDLEDPAFIHNDSSRVPVRPEDHLLKVLAVVGFDDQGENSNALVQRVPSPADQLLAVPPP